MSLASGTRLGPYEILAELGRGGMGEVYRAIDTNLKRAVAIKVLPASVATDAERLARFQREAEMLAALNHPHIAAIYGLERSDALAAIVMELVDGVTLADVIARGPLSPPDAAPIARQIAEALEAAHEQGIVHRDLKPANVKVRADGTVKVLDFGLAKALAPPLGGDSAQTSVPTITSPAMLTEIGMVLGTAAYMSPEQAKGRAADTRSDIWAFGCVLFEMLTGRMAFVGDTVQETLAAVLRDRPALDALPAETPSAIRRLIARCLERDPRQRLRDIGEARIALERVIAGADADATPERAVAAPSASTWQRLVPWSIAAAALIVAVAVIVTSGLTRSDPPPAPPLRLTTDIGADASLDVSIGASAVLSDDGQAMAFVAQADPKQSAQLYFRRLTERDASPLAGTSGARDPFFSPDGQWIGFFAAGALKKVSVKGGAPVTLAEAKNSRGGMWADDDTIVFQPLNFAGAGTGLMRVPAAGGPPEPLLQLAAGEVTQRWPQLLPGGRAVLFTSHTSTTLGYEEATIVVQPLPAGERKIVQRNGYYGRYVSSGHLLYVYQGTLFAAPFDLDRLEVRGPAVPALQGFATNSGLGGAQFATSTNGSLLYVPGEVTGNALVPVSWMDQKGVVTPAGAEIAIGASSVRVSPDGRHLAIVAGIGARRDIWIVDVERHTRSRLTEGGIEHGEPAWTPDGARVAFISSYAGQGSDIHWRRADGTGPIERLTHDGQTKIALMFHPGGQFLAYSGPTGLFLLPLEGNETSGWKAGASQGISPSSASGREFHPTFSPDGRWLAYVSTVSGRSEVHVRPFPGPGRSWQVSTNGGFDPVWSRVRPELLFSIPVGPIADRSEPAGTIMVASYSVKDDTFHSERPRRWSTRVMAMLAPGAGSAPRWDLHPAGDRVVGVVATTGGTLDAPAATRNRVVLVFNFFDELRRLAPVGR